MDIFPHSKLRRVGVIGAISAMDLDVAWVSRPHPPIDCAIRVDLP